MARAGRSGGPRRRAAWHPRAADDAALGLIARTFLAGGADRAGDTAGGRPGYQVAITCCDDCARTFAEANGYSVQLDPATVGAIECNHTARAGGTRQVSTTTSLRPRARGPASAAAAGDRGSA